VEDIIDNGHTIQVSVDRGSTLTLAEGEFHLKQLHFHMPSEHRLKGASFPMEVHFVHQADDGRFAVLAAFVSPGAENAQFASILEHVPATKGEHAHPDGVVLELGTHLPPTTRVLEYAGSLTTPPCTEGVLWLVLSETRVTASQAQLDAFAARIAPNNRPIQERRGRPLSAASVSVRQAP
jgi:carbonic anhydrase